MLPKNLRIPRKTFSLLAKGAKTFKQKPFLMRMVPHSTLRFSFSISKKVAKSAVMRNKMRRLGYSILENYIPEIKTKSLVAFSFQALPENEKEVVESLENILKESKLIK